MNQYEENCNVFQHPLKWLCTGERGSFQAGIQYVVQDITTGMLPLKQFLKYRDTRPEFDEMKKNGRVGLPCIVINNGEKILFELPENLDELRD